LSFVGIERILLTFRRHLLGSPIVLKTSESIWQCPVFGFIFYVSIHLEISETVMRAATGHNRQYDWAFLFSSQSLPLFRCG
jgi:hypothetical protein